MKMRPDSKILVTGAQGLVGTNLLSYLKGRYSNVIGVTRHDCDLENREQTIALLKKHQPEYVFHLAAKVGGIKANMSDQVGFLLKNAYIVLHTLEACYLAGVKKTLVLGSSCIYPRECPQPMKEEYLMTGPLEPTNEGYALSKILGVKLAQAYHHQHGMRVVCPMPSNIYGPGDTFDLDKSHVLSALVRRFVDAQRSSAPSVTLWGTGVARREFIHVRDVVRGLLFFMDQVEIPDLINMGPGEDVSIAELANLIREEVGYKGQIEWDKSKPDGMPKKCLDPSKLNQLGFRSEISLRDGVREVMKEYEGLLRSGRIK